MTPSIKLPTVRPCPDLAEQDRRWLALTVSGVRVNARDVADPHHPVAGDMPRPKVSARVKAACGVGVVGAVGSLAFASFLVEQQVVLLNVSLVSFILSCFVVMCAVFLVLETFWGPGPDVPPALTVKAGALSRSAQRLLAGAQQNARTILASATEQSERAAVDAALWSLANELAGADVLARWSAASMATNEQGLLPSRSTVTRIVLQGVWLYPARTSGSVGSTAHLPMMTRPQRAAAKADLDRLVVWRGRALAIADDLKALADASQMAQYTVTGDPRRELLMLHDTLRSRVAAADDVRSLLS